MNIVRDICCICLKNENNIRRLFNSCENLNYYSRLIVLFPEMNCTVLYDHGTMCLECCSKVDDTYKFREQCLRNSQIFINQTTQLSSVLETSDELCSELTGLNEKQKLPPEGSGESGKSYNSHNLSTEGNSGCALPGIGVDDEKNCDISPNINRESDVIKKEIYIKTEYKVADENKVKTETTHTAGWENEIKDTSNMCRCDTKSNFTTEEIYIKSEPVDSSEFEEELENAAVANTVVGTTSSNPDDSLVPVSVNKFKPDKKLKTHICGVCEKIFPPGNLTEHKLIYSNGKFNCQQCDKSFRYMSDLTKHIRIHSGEKPFKCEQCDKVFAQSSDLCKHRRTHSEGKPFKCEHCNKTFSHSVYLIKHKLLHSEEKPFKCDQCDKAFSRSTSLYTHKQIHSIGKYKCNNCDKAFSLKTNLTKHERIHSGEKPFKCDQCDKAFINKDYLAVHQRIHSGETPYKCDQCNKAFSRQTSLNNHRRIHSGEKPFKCDQCDKGFVQLSCLNKHKSVHSGEKPFKCDECHKAFSLSQCLIRHKRTHNR